MSYMTQMANDEMGITDPAAIEEMCDIVMSMRQGIWVERQEEQQTAFTFDFAEFYYVLLGGTLDVSGLAAAAGTSDDSPSLVEQTGSSLAVSL